MATAEVFTVNTGVIKHNGQIVAKRGDQLNKRAFAEKVKARALEMVALICPECGKEFGIRRGDIDKESLV